MKWNDDAFTIRRYIGIGGLLASALGLALIMRFTVAYLGDTTAPRENTLNVGYADVSIVETFNEPSELKMLNRDITKEVKVQNKGTVPAFVRVYAEFSDSELAAKAKVKLNNVFVDGCSWSDFKAALNYENITPDLAEKTKWRYVPADDSDNGALLGGYFYYIEALDAKTDAEQHPGGLTGPLFNSVTIDYRSTKEENGTQVPDTQDSNIDRIQPLEMIIYSELVQTVDTGKTTVTTTTVNGQGDPVPAAEEGGTAGNPVESSVYGYDFNKTEVGKDNWQDAWKRFLDKTTPRTETETVTQETPAEPEPEPEP